MALITLSALLTACTAQKITTFSSSGSCSNRVSTIYSQTEPTYCSTTYAPTNPVAITGTAVFQARTYTAGSGLSTTFTTSPIRFAEIEVTDSSGNVVQCGETNNLGQFTLQLPTSTETHTIAVRSRADNTHVKVSVLDCPEEMNPYALTTTVTPTSGGSVGTITATATNTGSLLGAAFNIYEQIVQANEFLEGELADCGTNFAGCTSFTVAPKVQAFWAKGFNPNDYFGGGGGVSFYLPSYSRLFILGGESGDIYYADTDHFDNSVILHEYGHFLEDIYSLSDSPGGAHYANSIIDPRLAWSEGWGNFIQAAIRDKASYRDTQGTPNAASPTTVSAYGIDAPIETSTGGSVGACSVNDGVTGCDLPEFDYEGNFREFTVTRALWDIFDSGANADSTGDEAISNKLQEVWAAITANTGFLDTSAAFRNMGLLHYVQMNNITGASNWSAIRTMHKQGDFTEYARYVDNIGGCGKTFTMTPYDDPNDLFGLLADSHLLRNNDFLHYSHPGGTLTLTMKAQTVDSSGGYTTELESDVDLYLYNGDAIYGEDIISSATHYWDNNPTTEQTETLTVSGLAAGNYLINVKIFTGRYRLDTSSATNNCIGAGFRQICENDPGPDYNYIPAGDEFDYEIEANGVDLCPAALP